MPPTGPPVARAEVEPDAKRLDAVRRGVEQRQHGLAEHQRDIPLEADLETFEMVSPRIGLRREVHPDGSVANLGGKGPDIVGPLVERAARLEVEAGVMPVASENTFADAAAREGKPHVWAAIVDGKHPFAVADNCQRAPLQVHDDASSRRDLVKRLCLDPATRG